MTWVTAVLLLVGTWGLLAGVVLLGREARAFQGDNGTEAANTTPKAASHVLLGVALLVSGSIILYIGLVFGGFLAPW